jgi:hypothetical protein
VDASSRAVVAALAMNLVARMVATAPTTARGHNNELEAALAAHTPCAWLAEAGNAAEKQGVHMENDTK